MGIAHLNMGMKKRILGSDGIIDLMLQTRQRLHGLHPNAFLLRSIGDDVAIPLQGMARPMLSAGNHVFDPSPSHPEPGIIVGP